MELKIAVGCSNCGKDNFISSLLEYESYKCPRCKSKVDLFLYEIDALQLIEKLMKEIENVL